MKQMKRYLLLLPAAALLSVGCTKVDPQSTDRMQPVEVRLTVEGATRVADNFFGATGLNFNLPLPMTLGFFGAYGAENDNKTVVVSGDSQNLSIGYTGTMFWPQNHNVAAVVYYPRIEGASLAVPVACNVAADQRVDPTASCFMYQRRSFDPYGTGAAYPFNGSGQLPVTLSQQRAWIVIDVVVPAANTVTEVRSATLDGTKIECNFDLATGLYTDFAATVEPQPIAMYNYTTVADIPVGVTKEFLCQIIPQTAELHIEIRAVDTSLGNTPKVYSFIIPSRAWVAGNRYDFTATLSENLNIR